LKVGLQRLLVSSIDIPHAKLFMGVGQLAADLQSRTLYFAGVGDYLLLLIDRTEVTPHLVVRNAGMKMTS